MLCRVGLDIGWLYTKRAHVVVIDFGIGDITSKRELVTASQDSGQQIKDYGGPRIADMSKVVDRGPAQVHRHLAFLQWLERDFPAQECVMQLYGHSVWVRPIKKRNHNNIADGGYARYSSGPQ
jgi:hypothetical protein